MFLFNLELFPLFNFFESNFSLKFEKNLGIQLLIKYYDTNFKKFQKVKVYKSWNIKIHNQMYIEKYTKTWFDHEEKVQNFSLDNFFPFSCDCGSENTNKPLLIYNKFSNLTLVNEFEKYTEITVSYAPKDMIHWEDLKFDCLSTVISSSLSSYKSLNQFQLRLFPFVFSSDSNLLIGAPTGSGKTILIVLSVLRVVINSIQLKSNCGKINEKYLKVLYIAPMKALVKEMVKTIGKCFKYLGLMISEITGETIINLNELNSCHIMIGTPEKIAMLLCGERKNKIFEKLKLLVVDEIHFLNEEKGSILENLLIYFLKNFIKKKKNLRLVALSATIPNFNDLAKFLNINCSSGLFYFGSSIRENTLKQIIIGIKPKNQCSLETKILNSILIQKISNLLNSRKTPKIVVFVQNRKDTYKTGTFLVENKRKDKILLNERSIFSSNKNNFSVSKILKILLENGIGIHHSGLSKKQKSFMEKNFESGLLNILISTNTLAWGVNLNATHVFIKGTKIYSPQKATWLEISGTNIIQMLGRTGRFYSDRNDSSFLLTTSKNIDRYVKLVKNQTPIESSLLVELPNFLNTEVAFQRISSLSGALDWFNETFLWIRVQRLMKKKNKDFRKKLFSEFQEIIKSFFISQSLNELSSSGLVQIISTNNLILSTIYGKICAYYHINYRVFLEIISKLSPNKNLCQLLHLLTLSSEFSDFLPRKNEKEELLRLSNIVAIPTKILDEKKEFKVNILIQSYIENIRVKHISLPIDQIPICKSALKLSRVMFEISLVKKWATVTQLCFDLYLAIKNRGWYFHLDPWKFIKGSIERKYIDYLKKKNFSLPFIQSLKNNELNFFMNSKKGPNNILESFTIFPLLELETSILFITKFTLKIDISFVFLRVNLNYFLKRYTGIWLFIEEQTCDTIIFTKYCGLEDLNKHKIYNISILLPIFEDPVSPFYILKFKFDTNPILNSEYKIDLSTILYPWNCSLRGNSINLFNTPISRLMIGFKGGNSLKEYFLSHLINFNRYFSENLHLLFKAGQNKISNFFEKKYRNFLNEWSIISNFLMKKKSKTFFSNTGMESTSLKIAYLRKNSNSILGIPIEIFFDKYSKKNQNFYSNKKIFLLKNLEIVSILKNLDFFETEQFSLIIDLNSINSSLEMESSFELIIEEINLKRNIKKIALIWITLPKISNLIDVIEALKLDNIFKATLLDDSSASEKYFSRHRNKIRKISTNKKKNSETSLFLQSINFKKNAFSKKNVSFFSNYDEFFMKFSKFISNSGIFFRSTCNRIFKDKFFNFFISNCPELSKSQKFYFIIGIGIFHHNMKKKKKKFTLECHLSEFIKYYWVSIPSLSYFPQEKLFCNIGILNKSVFAVNTFKSALISLNSLFDLCPKIITCNKKYLSRSTIKCSYHFSLESSWKKFFLEKGNLYLYSKKKIDFFSKNLYQRLRFFTERLKKNPKFYLNCLKNFEKITCEKISFMLFSKLEKKKIISSSYHYYVQTLKGFIMNKFFCTENLIRIALKLPFQKGENYCVNKNTHLLSYLTDAYKGIFSNECFPNKKRFIFLHNRKKELVYILTTFIDISEFFSYFKLTLNQIEKLRKIISKNPKIEPKFPFIFKNRKLSIFLLNKIHKISNYPLLAEYFFSSVNKAQLILKTIICIEIIFGLKAKFKWTILFSVVKKNKKSILNLILKKILSSGKNIQTFQKESKRKKDSYLWILIFNMNSHEILGNFRIKNRFTYLFKLVLDSNTVLEKVKIFIIEEKLIHNDTESYLNFS